MERLTNEIYKRVEDELRLNLPIEIYMVGCVESFIVPPSIEVSFIILKEDNSLIGGTLFTGYKRGLFGNYNVNPFDMHSTSLRLTEDEKNKIGFGDLNFTPPKAMREESMFDDHLPWFFHCLNNSKIFIKDITPEFESFIKGLVSKSKV